MEVARAVCKLGGFSTVTPLILQSISVKANNNCIPQSPISQNRVIVLSLKSGEAKFTFQYRTAKDGILNEV